MSASTDAGPAGPRDVTAILTTDHREALDLVQQIRSAPDAEQRRDLTDQLISELVRHSVAEEMYVYPVVEEEVPDGREQVEHDKSEHQELEEAMKALESADAGEGTFLEVLGKLEALLQDHVSDEEDDQFPQLRAAVDKDRLIEMGEQVERAKKLAPTRPHPSAPHSELFHKAVGPGVGFVDRLRDKLTGRNA